MYNCKYFPDHRVRVRDTPGFCRNVLQYFTDEGLGAGPFTATYRMKKKDAQGEEQEKYNTWKDEYVDRSQVLSALTDTKIGANGNNNWLSCDEFPWSTMEEGGNPNKNSRSCVPGYQHNIQGWFNGIISVMAQEIHEKKFTYHLFNSDSDTAVTGSEYEVFNHNLVPGAGDQDDMNKVIGVINTLGNPKYAIAKNELCQVTGTYDHPSWHSAGGLYVNTVECMVEFDNTAALAKIKRGEAPTQEEMFNIRSIHIAEDEPVHDIFIPFDEEDIDGETDMVHATLAPRSIGKHRRHKDHHS
ncbi:hypothetical protein BBP40_010257 [Aspergillus hancockii]|nr:hypothetical protein BBP40_010257 [Aspergillus hancockii]